METWLEFGRGPLFRFAFAIMILGLARIFVLTWIGMVEAYGRSADKIVPWKELGRKSFQWLFPVMKLWTKRPIYGAVSVLFHAGLILLPLFLSAHVLLWKRGVGVSWPALPQQAADWLTLVTLAAAAGLLAGRVFHKEARAISRMQDFVWPVLLAVPFLTGYLCSNVMLPPRGYQLFMLLHVYSANLIMALMPFTKIAHCVLMPLSQLVTGIAWKFPLGAGERVAATLGYAEKPIWVDKPRLERIGKEVAAR